jgi:hypothetical protein
MCCEIERKTPVKYNESIGVRSYLGKKKFVKIKHETDGKLD